MKTILILTSIIMCVGCSTNLHVMDMNTKPIKGATVIVYRYSLTGMPIKQTDENGITKIPWGIQEIETIHISKEGFKETYIPLWVLQKNNFHVALVPELKKYDEFVPKFWEPIDKEQLKR